MAEGPNDPQGPFLYREGGKTYASLPAEMLQNIQQSPLFREDGKRLQGRRYNNTQDNYGKRSSDSCFNSKGIPTESGRRENASNEQPSTDERTGGECDQE